MTIDGYIICATPRSGSTMLCDLLAGTGVAGRPASFYREQSIPGLARRLGVSESGPHDGAAFDRAYLDAVVREGTGDSGLFGLRLMWGSVAGLSRRLDDLLPGLPTDKARFERAFGSLACLHLEREDKVAQAVSRLKAEQTGLWHRAADGSERERTGPAQPPVYDANRLRALLEEVEHDEAAWDAWFGANGISPLHLTYEALAVDPQGELARVLAWLGLDPSRADGVPVTSSKMADAMSLEWASRFRAER